MSKSIYLVHSDKYKEWIFDETHPTQGRRFSNARDLLLEEASKDSIEVIEIPRTKSFTDFAELVFKSEIRCEKFSTDSLNFQTICDRCEAKSSFR